MITGGAVALQLLGQVGGYYESQKVSYEGEVGGKAFSLKKSRVAWGAKVGGCSIGSGGQDNQQLSDADVLKTVRSICRSPGGGEEEGRGGDDRCLCSLEDFEVLQLTEDWSPWGKDHEVLEEKVPTAHGDLLVAVRGRRGRPAILTYHDLGLNYLSNFQAFFGHSDMSAVLDNFCVYHVTAPGQEEGAAPLPPGHVYPSMDELADQISSVMIHFGLRSFVGFGVGAGANVLVRCALSHPHQVEGLFLVNCVSSRAGWLEWSYQKMTARQLRTKGMTPAVVDYLMWHHFGKDRERHHVGHAQLFRRYWESCVTAANLAAFVGSYARRRDLGVGRGRRGKRTLAAPLVNVTGANSPHVGATAALNSSLDPSNSSWIKVQDCGMVLVEQPRRVSQAFRLFLQGVGYAVQLSRNRLTSSSSTTQAAQTPRSGHGDSKSSDLQPLGKEGVNPELDSGHWKSSRSVEDGDSGRSHHGGHSDFGSCRGRSSVSSHHDGSPPRWRGRSNSVDDSSRSHRGIRRSSSHSGHRGAFPHHQGSCHSGRDRCRAASDSRGHQSSQHCCCAASNYRNHQCCQHSCRAASHSRHHQYCQHSCSAASHTRDHQCCQHSCSAASNSRGDQSSQHCSCADSHSNGHQSSQHCSCATSHSRSHQSSQDCCSAASHSRNHQCCQHSCCAASHSNRHHSCQHCCCAGGRSRGRRQRL